MTTSNVHHPPPMLLAEYARGTLDDARRESVERHILQCDSCSRFLRSVPDDTFMEELRGLAAPAETVAAEPHTETQGEIPETIPEALRDHPRYRVVERLGSGGMGVVFLAEHRLMERTVALKVIRQQLTEHPQAIERFHQEVKAAAQLAHRNIVTVHDADRAGDLHFLVMEYIAGSSLDAVVQKHGRLSVLHACNYIRQAAAGLQHAHEQGMVHRDIKPQNIMLTRKGLVKVLDFGLARLARRHDEESAASLHGLTREGVVLGTPDFMAPEQALNSRASDHRADIYSLGCTLYFALTGHIPFPGRSSLEKVVLHQTTEPNPVSDDRNDAPAGLVAILGRMMSKDVDLRFQSMAEVVDALAPFARSGPRPDSPDTLEPRSQQTVSDAPVRRERADRTPVPSVTVPNPLAPLAPAAPAPTFTTLSGQTPVPAVARGARPRRRHPLWAFPTTIVAGLLLVGVLISGLSYLARRQGDPQLPDKLGSHSSSAGAGSPAGLNAAIPAGAAVRVLIVLPFDNFWFSDYQKLRDALMRAGGVEVEVASSTTGVARPSPSEAQSRPVQVRVALAQADPDRYDAVIFSGAFPFESHEFVHDAARQREASRFITAMNERGKVVGSICNGTAVLARCGILAGKRAARNEYMPDIVADPTLAGWSNDPVTEVGNVFTARLPSDGPELARRVLLRLAAPSEP